jgi:hypothetical protein
MAPLNQGETYIVTHDLTLEGQDSECFTIRSENFGQEVLVDYQEIDALIAALQEFKEA